MSGRSPDGVSVRRLRVVVGVVWRLVVHASPPLLPAVCVLLPPPRAQVMMAEL